MALDIVRPSFDAAAAPNEVNSILRAVNGLTAPDDNPKVAARSVVHTVETNVGKYTTTSTVEAAQPAKKRVVVVGGGPVGSFLALKLAKAGIEVDLLERHQSLENRPRACGYFGATALAFQETGIYDRVRKEGFMSAGLCWRDPPVQDGNGGKKLGNDFAKLPLCHPKDESDPPFPTGLLNLTQSALNRLLVEEALMTGNVAIHYGRELESLEDNGDSVTAITKDAIDGTVHKYIGAYLVGADGARSATRKLLGLQFQGHTWPERIIASDVWLHNHDPERQLYGTAYVMHNKNPTVVTPLTDPLPGHKSLWRYAISIPADDTRSDEELLREDTLLEFYEELMAGPRPLQVEVAQRAMYRIHQRLVPTMRRNRVVLAGDAAHVNCPYGALGLNTGLLDADALADALTMIINESKPDVLLDIYSDERRKVFQTFVSPTSSANKLRLHGHDTAQACKDDWMFRLLREGSVENIKALSAPYFTTWRTTIRGLAAARGL